MHGYIELEDTGIDEVLWYRRRVWAAFCNILFAGVIVVVILCKVEPHGSLAMFVSHEPHDDHPDDNAESSDWLNRMQSS